MKRKDKREGHSKTRDGMVLLLIALVLLLAAAAALSIPALRALRRVDVTVRTASPLFRGPLLQQKPTPTAATAARRYAARLVGGDSSATQASSPEPQLFSLPGPSPALAPFILAGWLRGAVSGPAMFCTLLFGGARQMLPTAAEGAEAALGKAAATTPTSPWLAGDVALLSGQEEEVLRIRARTLSSRWLPFFRDVEARVVFEREEKKGDEAAGGGDATTLLLRARCEATVRGVPALLEGAARAAVEQAHSRLSRDVATELMRAATLDEGGGDGWAAAAVS